MLLARYTRKIVLFSGAIALISSLSIGLSTTTDSAAIRLLVMLIIVISNWLSIQLLILSRRTENVTAVLEEYQDQQMIFSMFNRAPVEELSKAKVEEFSFWRLPLENYLFLGENAWYLRDRFVANCQNRLRQDIIVLNWQDKKESLNLTGLIGQRSQTSSSDDHTLVFVLADKVDKLDYLKLKNKNIFWLVCSTMDQPIEYKILAPELAKAQDPSWTGMAFNDGRKMYRLIGY